MLKKFSEKIGFKQDDEFDAWLEPQHKKALMLGIVFMLMTATVLSYYDYLYYADTVFEDMEDPPDRYFGFNDAFRLIVVPMASLTMLVLARTRWNNSRLKRNWLAGIVLFSSCAGILSTWLCEAHYNANDYTYDMLAPIVFSLVLFGLRFRTSLLFSAVMVASVLLVLSLDKEVKPAVLFFNSTLTLLVWLPVVVGTWQLEQARFTNFRTITELERAKQELLKQTEALKSKNDDLRQFAYASSHDLQEPLRTISNFGKVLDRRLEGQLSEENRLYLDIVLKSAERMMKLIQAMLEYSRIGRNKNLETFDCNELVHGVLSDLSLVIQETGARIEVGHLPKVTGYRAELAMLIQNLVSNALKFRNPGSSPLIHIEAKLIGQEHVFSVMDNGIGIDPKYSERIFQLFARLHSKDEYEGTGIGLTHSKKIVELHGGRIWLESTPSRGTTFYFSIPVSININTIDEQEIELRHAD